MIPLNLNRIAFYSAPRRAFRPQRLDQLIQIRCDRIEPLDQRHYLPLTAILDANSRRLLRWQDDLSRRIARAAALLHHLPAALAGDGTLKRCSIEETHESDCLLVD